MLRYVYLVHNKGNVRDNFKHQGSSIQQYMTKRCIAMINVVCLVWTLILDYTCWLIQIFIIIWSARGAHVWVCGAPSGMDQAQHGYSPWMCSGNEFVYGSMSRQLSDSLPFRKIWRTRCCWCYPSWCGTCGAGEPRQCKQWNET